MKRLIHILCILSVVLFAQSCSDDDPDTQLNNDCIKRSLGPNVVGLEIEFVYAMALPSGTGNIVSAQVEATIPGAGGTWLEHHSYHTNAAGEDEGIVIGNPSTTSGSRTEVTFTRDTCAAALRYYYQIPEEARGKDVSFTFSARSSNNETVTYQMGPYKIASMDIALDMIATNEEKCYISLADMKVYDVAEAAANPSKIDLVYLYRKVDGITFEHGFVSPSAGTEFLQGAVVPSGAANKTTIRKVYGLRDRHLARLQYGVYVDDLDFIELDLTGMPDYAINVKNEGGIWAETQDGKYRAYIYVNEVNPGSSNPQIPDKSARISIKRYMMK